MTKVVAAAVLAIAIISLAACGAAHHGPAKPTAAQCSAANAAVSQVSALTHPYVGLTSQQALINADMQIASESSATGSADSYALAVRHAAFGAPAKLAQALRQAASDYLSFTSQNNGPGVSYQAVTQDAGYVMSDISAVQAICP